VVLLMLLKDRLGQRRLSGLSLASGREEVPRLADAVAAECIIAAEEGDIGRHPLPVHKLRRRAATREARS
jgi:hypothetical protein